MPFEQPRKNPAQETTKLMQQVRKRKEAGEKVLIAHIGEYKITISCSHTNEAAIESILTQLYEFEANDTLKDRLSGKVDTKLFGKDLFTKCKRHVDLFWGQHRTDQEVTGMVTPLQEMLAAADITEVIESESAQAIARKYGYAGIHFVAPLVSIRNKEPWNKKKRGWENQLLIYERSQNIKVRASKILTLGVISMVPGYIFITAAAVAKKGRMLIEANPPGKFVRELSNLFIQNGITPAYDFVSRQLIITSDEDGEETVHMIDTEAFRAS